MATMFVLRPLIMMDYSFYLHQMLRYRDLDQNAKTETEIPAYYFLSRLILPALEKIGTTVDSIHAQTDLARIGLELQQYITENGAYPRTLDDLGLTGTELKDPFSSNSYKYRNDGARILVYSIGENRSDDNGATTANRGGSQKDPLDIVWFAKK